MKILLCADAHGEIPIVGNNKKIDLILVAGDFAKGDALRKMIFEGGSREQAKKEIIDSSEFFLKKLKQFHCPVVVSLGNAEEFCKKEIVELIKKNKIFYTENGIVEINNLKILCVDFFLEEWWVEKYQSARLDRFERARKDEKNLKQALSKVEYADVILTHLPPYEMLDLSERNDYIKMPGGKIGSKILREFIDKTKPKLVVCGHLHNPGQKQFGKTLAVNPGKEKIIEL